MYERSANVLERYFDNLFGFNKPNNLRLNFENYSNIIVELKEYQKTEIEEEKIIVKFEEAAKQIEEMQTKQANLHELNLELENERNKFFTDLSANPNSLDTKLQKIESKIEENNNELQNIREQYVKTLVIFTERQKERNKYAKTRKSAESNYMNNVENANKIFETVDINDVNRIKKFIESNSKETMQDIIDIMLQNGRNERIPFNKDVVEKAVKARIDIAVKEAEIYIAIYERTKRLLNEINNNNVKLARSEKLVRDASVKLAFLNAKKEYIFSFLDNERMTTINGKKAHEKFMQEACENFDLDMKQIENLYELILKEVAGRSTKKAYKELYNKTYLKDIQEKEKNFAEAVTNIKINMATVINSNYWRIEGIKNIYNVFQEEVSEKFEKDLSELKVEDIEEKVLPGIDDMAEENEYTYNDDDYDEIENNEYDSEYEDDEIKEAEDDYEKYDDEKYDDEEYDDEEYDDEEYDDEEYDDEEYDDEEYDDEEFEDVQFDEDEEYEESEYDEDENEDYEEDEDLLEEKIDEIIENSRKKGGRKKKKNKIKNDNKDQKGLFGKLFKK